MNDETLKKIHAIKDERGERFTTLSGLAKELSLHERQSAKEGRLLITLPQPPTQVLRKKVPVSARKPRRIKNLIKLRSN